MEDKSIFEALVSCRNILIEGRINQHVTTELRRILLNLQAIESPFIRDIVGYSVRQSIILIDGQELVGAGRVLNLIHNLPFNLEKRQRWDIDYFLSMELSSFLEHFEEIKPARQVVLCICKGLAAMYSLERL